MSNRSKGKRLLIAALVAANVLVALALAPSAASADQTLNRQCTFSSGCGGGSGCNLCLISSVSTCLYDGNCWQ